MFDELIGKKVKIVYNHMGKEKAVFGILLGEDDKNFKLKFSSGDIVGISKNVLIRLSEEQGG